MADYADRLKEEYADHREDEMELEQISGVKNIDASSLGDALEGSELEQKKVLKKQKIGWVLFGIALLYYFINGILEDIIPFFQKPLYMFFSDAIEIGLVGVAALCFFSSFSSNLFKK